MVLWTWYLLASTSSSFILVKSCSTLETLFLYMICKLCPADNFALTANLQGNFSI